MSDEYLTLTVDNDRMSEVIKRFHRVLGEYTLRIQPDDVRENDTEDPPPRSCVTINVTECAICTAEELYRDFEELVLGARIFRFNSSDTCTVLK